jgi:hypothetical protein
MKPGPTTAKKIRSRIFQRFRKVMRGPEIAQATDQHKWIEDIWIAEIAGGTSSCGADTLVRRL